MFSNIFLDVDEHVLRCLMMIVKVLFFDVVKVLNVLICLLNVRCCLDVLTF